MPAAPGLERLLFQRVCHVRISEGDPEDDAEMLALSMCLAQFVTRLVTNRRLTLRVDLAEESDVLEVRARVTVSDALS